MSSVFRVFETGSGHVELVLFLVFCDSVEVAFFVLFVAHDVLPLFEASLSPNIVKPSEVARQDQFALAPQSRLKLSVNILLPGQFVDSTAKAFVKTIENLGIFVLLIPFQEVKLLDCLALPFVKPFALVIRVQVNSK